MQVTLGLYIKKPNSKDFLLLKKGTSVPINEAREPLSPQQMINSIAELRKYKHEWILNGTNEYQTAKYLIQSIESHLRTAPGISEYIAKHAGNA